MIALLQITAAPEQTFDQLSQAIDQLLNTQAVLVPLAVRWSYFFAVLAALNFCKDAALHALADRDENILADGIPFLCKLVTVATLLRYYANPIPGIGIPFPAIFTTIGQQIADTIKLASLDLLIQQINDCITGIQYPPALNPFALIIYFFVIFGMGVLDTALLIITSFGYFAIGIGNVFGSLAIALLLLPGWSQKFWNWVNYMFVYGMYRATAAAVVFVLSTFLVHFFQGTLHGQWDLGHLYGMFFFLIIAIGATVFFAFKTPHFNNELWGGGLGHAGADFGAHCASSFRAFILMTVRRG